nr:MAG TPA_asm: hypothetical protein [Caudoviricetes sp.]DAX12458.1 MAG TPA: hypothetical protein [Caudoviricetes sp.]
MSISAILQFSRLPWSGHTPDKSGRTFSPPCMLFLTNVP